MTFRRGLLAAICLSFFQATAIAGGLRVTPLLVDVSPSQLDASVNVQNLTNSPITVQARLYRWTQPEGRDELIETKDWLFTPPIFKLPAQGKQNLRLRFQGALSRDGLQSYRLYLDSLPDRSKAGGSGVGFRFRIGLPVFVQPVESTPANLQVVATREAGRGHILRLTNSGGSAVRVLEVLAKLAENPNSEILKTYSQSQVGAGWLLPGATQVWPIEDSKSQAVGLEIRLLGEVAKLTGASFLSERRIWIERLP